MSRWTEIGPLWNSEQALQIMELLSCMHIPSRTFPEEFSFVNRMLHIDPDRKWPVLVRRRDMEAAVLILEQEGLLNPKTLLKSGRS